MRDQEKCDVGPGLGPPAPSAQLPAVIAGTAEHGARCRPGLDKIDNATYNTRNNWALHSPALLGDDAQHNVASHALLNAARGVVWVRDRSRGPGHFEALHVGGLITHTAEATKGNAQVQQTLGLAGLHFATAR